MLNELVQVQNVPQIGTGNQEAYSVSNRAQSLIKT